MTYINSDTKRVMEISDERYWWRKYYGWARNDNATPDIVTLRRIDTDYGTEEFISDVRGYTIKIYTIQYQWYVKIFDMVVHVKSFIQAIYYLEAMLDVTFVMEGHTDT